MNVKGVRGKYFYIVTKPDNDKLGAGYEIATARLRRTSQ
jgi:hypothetical protein